MRGCKFVIQPHEMRVSGHGAVVIGAMSHSVTDVDTGVKQADRYKKASTLGSPRGIETKAVFIIVHIPKSRWLIKPTPHIYISLCNKCPGWKRDLSDLCWILSELIDVYEHQI
ncbi:hypothetical protein TWF217_008099 [Orbilia oligospora]|nr:hypothetical protein TWF217_008099 [Orbilia oligospora]